MTFRILRIAATGHLPVDTVQVRSNDAILNLHVLSGEFVVTATSAAGCGDAAGMLETAKIERAQWIRELVATL